MTNKIKVFAERVIGTSDRVKTPKTYVIVELSDTTITIQGSNSSYGYRISKEELLKAIIGDKSKKSEAEEARALLRSIDK